MVAWDSLLHAIPDAMVHHLHVDKSVIPVYLTINLMYRNNA